MARFENVGNPPKLSREMQMDFHHAFKEWVRVVMHGKRSLFEERFKIKCLWSLKDLIADYDMLRASSMFWDERRHVFCFSHNEMVPTLEDFRALLGGDEAVNIAMPLPGGVSMVEKLSLLLGISFEEAQGMAHGPDHFVVSSFPCRFGNVASDEAWNAFAICVLGTLFTVYSFGICHRSLLDVVVQWGSGCDIAPLVLGETLHALDRLSSGKKYMHGGSPILLSMWLMERLGILREAVGGVKPWTFTRRGSALQFDDQAAWELWMSRLRTRDLRWWIPHWRIETQRTVQEGSHVVIVPGLCWTSFYIPSLVLRQFGMEQLVPRDFEDISTMTVAPRLMDDPATFSFLVRAWGHDSFPIVVLLRQPERIFLTTEYLDWYTRHMGATHVDLVRGRDAVAAMELRRIEARSCPYDRSGDAMADYEDFMKERRHRVPLGMDRVRMRGERERAAQALRDAGLEDPALVPEIGRRRTDILPVQRKTTRRRSKKRRGTDGAGTSG